MWLLCVVVALNGCSMRQVRVEGSYVGDAVRDPSFARVLVVGLTANGQPRHPLYIGYATAPQVWA